MRKLLLEEKNLNRKIEIKKLNGQAIDLNRK